MRHAQLLMQYLRPDCLENKSSEKVGILKSKQLDQTAWDLRVSFHCFLLPFLLSFFISCSPLVRVLKKVQYMNCNKIDNVCNGSFIFD